MVDEEENAINLAHRMRLHWRASQPGEFALFRTTVKVQGKHNARKRVLGYTGTRRQVCQILLNHEIFTFSITQLGASVGHRRMHAFSFKTTQ